MPVCNGADYLDQAIESVLAQTWQDYEIIVVNDGSTDGGAARSLVSRYGDRICYVEQENKGVAGALNAGIVAMRGELFVWLSHDDLFKPEKLERQIALYDRLNDPEIILYSNYGLIDESGDFITNVAMERVLGGQPQLALLRGCVNGCTVLVPRIAFDRIGLFDERLRFTQDYDLWDKLRLHYDFILQPEVLVLTRQRGNQGSHHSSAIGEGESLWRRMIDNRSLVERALMCGGNYRFLRGMEKFLRATPYQQTAEYAGYLAEDSIAGTLVSVVIPFHNEVELACRALKSALAQSHTKLDVLLIDDGSSESDAPLREVAAADDRVRMVRRPNGGASSARNVGMELAKGEYIAFLDRDDYFLPQKIEVQLRQMQEQGSLVSHTSYAATHPARGLGPATVHSGRISGNLFPKLIGDCTIATPTVMLHRALVAAGFQFQENVKVGEDTILWCELAREHPILGIDQALTVVEMSDTSAALNIRKSIAGLTNIRDAFGSTQWRDGSRYQVAALSNSINSLQGLDAGGTAVNHSLLKALFQRSAS